MLPRRSHRQLKILSLLALALSAAGCSDTSGPGIAVHLSLYSVDRVVMPVQLRTPGGKLVTLANGELQGTNWGHACGVSFRLAEGPITAVEIGSCRLKRGEERRFTLTLTDSRFPAGAHEYRFAELR